MQIYIYIPFSLSLPRLDLSFDLHAFNGQPRKHPCMSLSIFKGIPRVFHNQSSQQPPFIKCEALCNKKVYMIKSMM